MYPGRVKIQTILMEMKIIPNQCLGQVLRFWQEGLLVDHQGSLVDLSLLKKL